MRSLGATALPAQQPATPEWLVQRLDLAQPWPQDVAALFDGVAAESPEVSPAWYSNLYRTVFANHPGAALWVLRKNGRAVAALPALVQDDGFGRRLTVLGNYYTAFYAPAVAQDLSAEDLSRLFVHLVRHCGNLGRLAFEPMDPQSIGYRLLFRALELAGLMCFKYFRFGNWYLPAPPNWAAYLAGRSANQRSAIKRTSRKLADAGGRVEIITAVADVERGLAAYWQVYAASWKPDEPHPAFINGLAHWAAAAGQLRLGVAWLHGKPLAAQLWLVSGGKAEIYKLAYDEAFKHLTPGNMLTVALMRDAIERDGVAEVDYLIGDDVYKQTWMSHRRERWGIQAYHPLRLGGIAGLLQEAAGWLARAIRQRWPRQHAT